jgi:hypothetical protein
MTFCAAAVLGMGWNATLSAFLVFCSVYPGGDLYEILRDRLLARFGGNTDGTWILRFFLYMAVVPLFPFAMLHVLHVFGMPGLKNAIDQGLWSAGAGVSLLFGYFRICGMPLSFRAITKPLRHIRASK